MKPGTYLLKTTRGLTALAGDPEVSRNSKTQTEAATAAFRVSVFLSLGFIGFAPGASAQSPGSTPRDELVERLIKRVEGLEAEVKAMKGAARHAGSPDPAGDTGAEEAAARTSFPEVKFHGFADVQYRASDRAGQKNSFTLGQLDFFVTSRLSEDVSVLNENVVEASDENAFGFEIERLLLQYTPSDYFNVAVGRGHTAIGYYNNAYHHGTWFQTATERPFVFNFEDDEGILATHNVGVSVSGRIPSGRLGLRYVAEVGNGRNYTADQESVLSVKDNNSHKALNLALLARPMSWPGLQGGVSVYQDRLTTEGLPDITQTIFTAHLVYPTPAFEWLNEGMVFRHAPSDSGRVFYTPAFYTQFAKQFGKFRPYVRYQYLDAPTGDPLFAYLGLSGLRHGPSAGLRYDFTELATLKLQYDHYFEPGGIDVNQFTAQVGFTF